MHETGTIERLFTAPEAEAEMREHREVEAVEASGLREDRYFSEIETGTFVSWDPNEPRPEGYDLTLIEQEALDAIEREADIDLAPGDHRRNIETSGTPLNHLVGERFRVGDVVCVGDRLCEPCGFLERHTEDGVEAALTHRGGLRADVLEGGTIKAGAEISVLE